MDKPKVHKGEGHRKRLRERFFDSGLSGFQDYEVIELLLTLSTPRKDCKDAAKYLLKKFKDFHKVFEASDKKLQEIKGIGPTNLLGIKLVKAVADRYLEKKILYKDGISNSKELQNYLYHVIGYKTKECFKVIFLDAKNKIIANKTLFTGTLTSSAIYPREVVQSALNNNAAALIFAHNHPSGDPAPSQDDIDITRQLFNACKVVGITVHEHIIIGHDSYFSFADKGYIAKFVNEYSI